MIRLGSPRGFVTAVLAALTMTGTARTTVAAEAPRTTGSLTLRGHVLEEATREGLPDARVRILEPPMETASRRDGAFEFSGLSEGIYTIEAGRVGYGTKRASVMLDADAPPVDLLLRLRPLTVPDVEVTTTRATERKTPVAFTDVSRHTIEERYWAQDVPMLLAETPGVYAYSDAGNGVGYSYVKVRGFSQRRVAVTINGIPLNDPETHEVYWVDHPDLLASAQSVQVQRGVGSALYGASAVGGAVNLETMRVPVVRTASIETGFGSYGTQRFAMAYQSGLVDGRYALSGRYSRILSDGYREQSWSRLWSYYFSAARLDSRVTTRVNLYGGPERLHLAFFGVDRAYLDGRITGNPDRDRRFNPLTWRNETDNFFEPHYELIQDFALTDRVSLTSSAFYFPGEGYYEDLPYGPISFASYNLPDFEVDSDSLYPASYYESDAGGVPVQQPNGRYKVTGTDLTQKLWVRNRHYGWIPRARVEHARGSLLFGGEWREHDGRHWGELTWGAALPPGTEPNHVFHDYTGRVNVLSAFVQETFEARPGLDVTGSLQWRRTRYAIGKERYKGYDFSLAYSFLNPRVALNWNVTGRWNAFANYAHASVEPILSEIYRADDPAAVPLFRVVDPTNSRYEDPLIDPERLNDYEVGVGYRDGDIHARVTGYLLDFSNEIVPSGQIDALGVPVTGNAARSTHLGLEAEFAGRLGPGFEIKGNATLSRNRFDHYVEYVDATTINDFGGNAIAGFPSRMANLTLAYRRGGVAAALTLAETGRQYLDNTNDNRKNPGLREAPGYQRTFIEEHAVLNASISLEVGRFVRRLPFDARSISLDLHLHNLTDLRYETAGYVYAEVPYFYPAARRSAFVSLKAEF